MPSKQTQVNQLVLKVSAPKRTGRKRKRGSNDPFLPETEVETGSARVTTLPSTLGPESVFRAIRDNSDRYTVTAVGHLKESHRFRSMPDYQYATSTNTLITKFRNTIMSRNYEDIQNFELDGVKGLPKGQDIGPPPFFSVNKQPYNYNYRQNTYVKLVTDENGQVTTVNVTAPAKHIKTYLDPDDPTVPTAPPAELPPESTLEPRMREWIAKLRAELDKRPMMQRRVYSNIFKGDHEMELKRAAGYVGYTFSSGPFKDVLIKFGVDPRSDPKYRFYQAVAFQIPAEGHSAPDDPGSYMNTRGGKRVSRGVKKRWVEGTHLFDGSKFYRDGKIWQVCDITEPFLKALMETAEVRSSCDVSSLHLH
jgi:general transcription factor 3C polypeptide 5 (transcription factor C subunit 1)